MKIIAKRETDLQITEFTDMVRKNRLTKILSVGDQLTVNCDGKPLLLDVIDINRDGEDTVTVQTHYVLDELMQYNENGQLAWNTSDIRHFLHRVFLPRLDAEFVSVLAARKSTNTIGEDTLDRVFIPSVDEMVNGYEYYRTQERTVKTNRDGEYKTYWVRCPSAWAETGTWCCGGGYYRRQTGNSSLAVAPCMVIGREQYE